MAHLGNFGLYGTPQREVVFDLNDFDGTVVGPWEWDLKRLTASANVAGRENGLSTREGRTAVAEVRRPHKSRALEGVENSISKLSPAGTAELSPGR